MGSTGETYAVGPDRMFRSNSRFAKDLGVDSLAQLKEKLAEIGTVDIACVPVGGALSANRAVELISQLEPKIVIPIATDDDEAAFAEALGKFLHEMGATRTPAQQKLAITISGLPDEVTTVLLEPRGG